MANILRIRNTTRVLGKSQGYLGLPLRDELMLDPTSGQLVNAMLSAWELTPAEIIDLVDGKPLILRILGVNHPPVMLFVGDGE